MVPTSVEPKRIQRNCIAVQARKGWGSVRYSAGGNDQTIRQSKQVAAVLALCRHGMTRANMICHLLERLLADRSTPSKDGSSIKRSSVNFYEVVR